MFKLVPKATLSRDRWENGGESVSMFIMLRCKNEALALCNKIIYDLLDQSPVCPFTSTWHKGVITVVSVFLYNIMQYFYFNFYVCIHILDIQ